MATDARVRYTKKMIRQAFLNLLDQKPLSRITVTEVCRMAEINRATFYKHYQDVYDLMDRTEEEMLNSFHESLVSIEHRGMKKVVPEIMEAIRQKADPYLAVFSSNGDPELASRMVRMGFDMFSDRIGISIEGKDAEKKRHMCYLYISSGSAGVIEQWIREGFKDDPAEIADEIIEFSDATLKGMSAG